MPDPTETPEDVNPAEPVETHRERQIDFGDVWAASIVLHDELGHVEPWEMCLLNDETIAGRMLLEVNFDVLVAERDRINKWGSDAPSLTDAVIEWLGPDHDEETCDGIVDLIAEFRAKCDNYRAVVDAVRKWDKTHGEELRSTLAALPKPEDR